MIRRGSSLRLLEEPVKAVTNTVTGAVTTPIVFSPIVHDRQSWIADPRPDIRPDSALWHRLLELAYDIDGRDASGLFGTLHGCRCGGAKLLPVPPDKVRLTQGEWGTAEWAMLREGWLMPQAEKLTGLLKRVRANAETR